MPTLSRNVSLKISVLIVFVSMPLLLLVLTVPVQAGSVYYAASSAVGSGDCLSWENACTLQTALGNSLSGDEIWVLAGVHKPTTVITDRAATFNMLDGVGIYGGFAGWESAREERDWEVNLTILSGDIDSNDLTDPAGVVTSTANITGTNSFHVVTGDGVGATAVLDGFIINAGYANGTYFNNCGDVCGGGLYNFQGHPTLNNLTFIGNHADNNGGGLYNNGNSIGSSPTISDTTFINNDSTYGGGMASEFNSNPVLTNVSFSGNRAVNFGGAMFNQIASPILINTSFTNNQSQAGGGMYNLSSSAILTTATFSGNTAISGGGIYNTDSSGLHALMDVTFTGNEASSLGGALYNYGSILLDNVTFNSNTGYDGGGFYSFGNTSYTTTLQTVTFSGNIAEYGGGMFDVFGQATLTDVLFLGNTGNSFGGGLYENHGSAVLTNVRFEDNLSQAGGAMAAYDSSPALTNVLFRGNDASILLWPHEDSGRGGGIYNFGSHPTLTNATFSGNQAEVGGGAMYSRSTSNPEINNSIFWGDTPEEFNSDATGTLAINSSNVAGGCPVGGTCSHLLDSNPLFVDPSGGDLRLLPGSPSIDAGDNSVITTTTDLAGAPRFVDVPGSPDTGLGSPPLVDMGAYEASFVDAALHKTVGPASYTPGTGITFTLSISNGGSITATNMTVSDEVPWYLTAPSWSASGAAVSNTGQLPQYIWSVQDLSPGQGALITVTGVLTVPLAAGVYTNTAIIEVDQDAATENNLAAVTFEVSNVAPIFTSIPITAATQGTPYGYNISTEDLNGDVLTVTAPTKPEWLTLSDNGDGTATLSGTPVNGDVGDHAVLLRVTDGGGLTADQPFTITVANVNDPPAFTSVPITAATQDLLYSYSVTADDPDLIWGDTVTITAPMKPDWLSLIGNGNSTATLSGTPGNGDVGDHAVLLSVTDADGLADDQSFTITVVNVNDQPVFTSTPITNATQSLLYSYIITVTDQDLTWGDVLTITAPTKPGWLMLVDNGDGTAMLSGTPDNGDVGDHPVLLLVIDSGGLADEQPFTITVANLNEVPVFTSVPITTATQGLLYSYVITANDSDLTWGDVLTITAPTKPGWLTLVDNGDGTATLFGTPDNGDVGGHPVMLLVFDSGGLADTQSFTIRIRYLVYLPLLITDS